MKKAIAIITARGGSKRIPRKNIKEFCGKPMIQYSIEAALASGIFDEVMVSTDDEEIAQISREAGAKVPFMRSEKTSNDYAVTADVLMEVLEEYEKRGMEFESMCCIYPTAPFLTGEKLQEAYELLNTRDANQVLPLIPFSFPPQRCHVIDGDYAVMKWPEHKNTRSQDLEPYYHDCGQFYFYKVSAFLEAKGSITEKIVPLLLSELEVQDIDNSTDWKLAELKYRMMMEKEA